MTAITPPAIDNEKKKKMEKVKEDLLAFKALLDERMNKKDERMNKNVPTLPKPQSKNSLRVLTKYMCYCEKVFATKQKMVEHARNVHGGDRFLCTICNIWFAAKSSLILHYKRKMHDAAAMKHL